MSELSSPSRAQNAIVNATRDLTYPRLSRATDIDNLSVSSIMKRVMSHYFLPSDSSMRANTNRCISQISQHKPAVVCVDGQSACLEVNPEADHILRCKHTDSCLDRIRGCRNCSSGPSGLYPVVDSTENTLREEAEVLTPWVVIYGTHPSAWKH